MANLPTSDDAFGKQLPTADDAFGPVQQTQPSSFTGGMADFIFNDLSEGRVLKAMGQGAADGWGDKSLNVLEQSDDWLRKAGVYNDYNTGKKNYVKSFNEAILRPLIIGPLAAGLETTLRTGSAALGVVSSGTEAVAEELGRKGNDLQESARQTNIIPQLSPSYALGGAMKGAAELAGDIGAGAGFDVFPEYHGLKSSADVTTQAFKARAAGAVGEGEIGFFNTQEVKPSNIEARKAASEEVGAVPHPIEPPTTDPNAVARQINPELFDKWDALKSEQENLRLSRGYLTAQLGEDYKTNQRITGQLEDIPGRIQALDEKLRDLIPEVADTRDFAEKAVKSSFQYREGGPTFAESFQDLLQQKILENELALRETAQDIGMTHQHADLLMAPPEEPSPEPQKATSGPQKPVQTDQGVPGSQVAQTPETPSTSSTSLYRGTGKDRTPGEQPFLTEDRAIAEMYAGPEGIVTEHQNNFKNVLNAKNWFEAKSKLGLPTNTSMPDLIKAATEAGYDGLTFKTTNGKEYIRLKKEAAPEYERPNDTSSASPGSFVPSKETSGEAYKARLEATKGTGETRLQGLASRVNKEAVEAEIVKPEEWDPLPIYGSTDTKLEAELITNLIKEDPKRALDVAMGRAAPPEGVRTPAVWRVLKNLAVENEDGELLHDLAFKSPVGSIATKAGSYLQALREESLEEDPSRILTSIQESRENSPEVKKTANQINRFLDSFSPDVESFIKNLECDY